MSIKQYCLIIDCTLSVATYQKIDSKLNIYYSDEVPPAIGNHEKVNYGSLSGSVIRNYEQEQDLYQMNAESFVSGSYARNSETDGNDVYFVYQNLNSFDYTKG